MGRMTDKTLHKFEDTLICRIQSLTTSELLALLEPWLKIASYDFKLPPYPLALLMDMPPVQLYFLHDNARDTIEPIADDSACAALLSLYRFCNKGLKIGVTFAELPQASKTKLMSLKHTLYLFDKTCNNPRLLDLMANSLIS